MSGHRNSRRTSLSRGLMMASTLSQAGALLALTSCMSAPLPPARSSAPIAAPGPTPFVPNREANIAALRALPRDRPCRPREVAPGVWVRHDCGDMSRILRALPLRPRVRLALTEAPLPASVDLRAWGYAGPVKNQKAIGACTAFSLSTVMDSALRKLGGAEIISPLHVWSNYGYPAVGRAGDGNLQHALTTEARWPYDPAKACRFARSEEEDCGTAYNVTPGSADRDPRLRAEKTVADQAGIYALTSVEELGTPPADLDDIAAVLAEGDAVWATFHLDEASWDQEHLLPDGAGPSGIIPDYAGRDSGHAVVLEGYRSTPQGRQFLVHNSWGPNWGQRGYAWLQERTAQRQFKAAYRIRVSQPGGSAPALPSRQALPPLTPAPAAPTGGCPSGQGLDTLFGSCSLLCPDGNTTVANVCVPRLPGMLPTPAPKPGPAPAGAPLPPPGPGPAAPASTGVFPFPFPLPFQLPYPVPNGTPSRCPMGQGPDAMNGQCTALCPAGQPPIGGFCFPGM